MPSRELKTVLTGEDKSLGATLDESASKGHAFGNALNTAFTQIGNTLGGEVGEVVAKLTEGLDSAGEHASKLTKVGAAATGVGLALTAMGDKEKAATQQLDAAIKNTGHSAEEFEGQIEDTVKRMEDYGYTATTTKQALQTLTNATHDPQKAIDLMGETADLAASRHKSLSAAASDLARVIGGKGARTLAQYNIGLVKNSDGTTNWDATNKKLAQTLSGQASAAADTWTGKLHHLQAAVEDQVAVFGQKYGPAIVATGTAMTVLGPITTKLGSGMGALGKRFLTTGAEAEAGASEVTAADEQIVASNEAAAASTEELAAAAKSSRLGMVGAGVGIAAFAVGAYAAGKSLAGLVEKGNSVAYNMDHLRGDLDNLTDSLVNNRSNMDAVGKSWLSNEIAADGLGHQLAEVGITTDSVVQKLAGFKDQKALVNYVSQLTKTNGISKTTALGLIELGSTYTTTKEKAEAATAATGKNSAALDTQKKKVAAAATVQQLAAKAAASDAAQQKQATLTMQMEGNAAGLLGQQLDKLNDQTLNVEKANISFKDANGQLTQAIKDNGKAFTDNTQKGRDNRSAVLDSISAAEDHANAVATQTRSVEKGSAAFHDDISALRDHLIALGVQKGGVDRLLGSFSHFKPTIVTTVEAKTAAAAAALEKIKHLEDEMAIADVQVRVNGNLSAKSAGSHLYNAGGTDFFPGGDTFVAERETEIVGLPRGSSITPESKMRGAGGGMHVTVNVVAPRVYAGSDLVLGRELAGHIGVFLKAGGRIPGIG